MTNPFAAPAPPGEGIKWADLNGRLLLISPLSIETGIQTTFGAADAVRANVVVLDGDNPGEEYADTLVFPKVLGGQLRSRLGEKVLGRLGQGVAKSGQSAPWLLNEATPQDIELGTRYLNSLNTPSQPAPPAAQQGTSVPF